MAKGKQGFFQSIRKYRHYLNKKKESSKIMADLRKAENDARTKFDDLNNQMNPLQVDLKAENNSLGVLQAQLQNMNTELHKNLGIRFDPLATTAQKRLAMKTILSAHAQGDRLTVVEDFTIDSGKTKDLVAILNNFAKDERTVLILKDDDEKIKQAGRNIPNLTFLSYNRLNAHDLYYGRKVIVLESAVANLSKFYDEEKEAK